MTVTGSQLPADDAHVDVLVVGAGFAGLGIARHLLHDHPQRTWAIVEARESLGGTWDLFRYPGVRSDSDLYTFGYAFRPWRGDSIATAPAILDYLRAMAAEEGIESRIRYRHRVRRASWDTRTGLWTVEIHDAGADRDVRLTCRWLVAAAGYFDHDRGHQPAIPGLDRFVEAGGTVVHPQHWPETLDHAGRRVVIIGSGATAVTLAPALARTAEVVVLQRSPSYVISAPTVDKVAVALQRVLPADAAHRVIRAKNIRLQRLSWSFLRRFPGAGRRLLLRFASKRLPKGYPVGVHFAPDYDPWDERLCAAPDGDFFAAISSGSVRMVTDRIAELDAEGIRLESGDHLRADLVVTATGLEVRILGGIELVVDGVAVDLHDTVTYRGMMLSGVPNLTYVFGYLYSSWTLKVELVAEQLAAILRHLDATGADSCTPVLDDPDMPRRPMLDMKSGYVRRATDRLPQQGDRYPWLTRTQYDDDVRLVRGAPAVDPHLRFARGMVASAAGAPEPAVRTPGRAPRHQHGRSARAR